MLKISPRLLQVVLTVFHLLVKKAPHLIFFMSLPNIK